MTHDELTVRVREKALECSFILNTKDIYISQLAEDKNKKNPTVDKILVDAEKIYKWLSKK